MNCFRASVISPLEMSPVSKVGPTRRRHTGNVYRINMLGGDAHALLFSPHKLYLSHRGLLCRKCRELFLFSVHFSYLFSLLLDLAEPEF